MTRAARTFLRLAIPAAVAALAFLSPASAGDVPQPDVPKAAAGTQCVRPADFMRRNHMAMLKHDRNLTVHQGDRAVEASLKECVTCHAVPGADGKAVTVADPKHFCRACHDYAAVKVDCFECHASRPETAGSASLPGSSNADVAALSAFVKEVAQ